MRKGGIGQVNRNTQQTNTNKLDVPIPPFLIPPFPISQSLQLRGASATRRRRRGKCATMTRPLQPVASLQACLCKFCPCKFTVITFASLPVQRRDVIAASSPLARPNRTTWTAFPGFQGYGLSILRIGYLVPRMLFLRQFSHEEFTRLAGTRLAQSTFTYIMVY